MTIQAGGFLRTKSGREVEIVSVLPVGKELDYGDAIIGILTDEDSRTVETWTRAGRYSPARESTLDLEMPS